MTRVVVYGIFDRMDKGRRHLLEYATRIATKLYVLIDSQNESSLGGRQHRVQNVLDQMTTLKQSQCEFLILPAGIEKHQELTVRALKPDLIIKGTQEDIGNHPVCLVPYVEEEQ